MEYVLGSILILCALFLIGAVLMQSGKSHNLSGTIAGGAETFFGKTKASTIDKKLSRATTIVSIVFVVLVLGFYVAQNSILFPSSSSPASTAADTSGVTISNLDNAASEAEATVEEAAAEAEAAAEDVDGGNG